MDPSLLCKPVGSLDDTLMIVSSYPTADPRSTVHLRYGTVDDLSNASMWTFYSKLGYHVATIRDHGLLHVDVCPMRNDRKLVAGGDSSMSLLRQLPADVREFWDSAAYVFIRLSNSKVALIVGNVAIRSYTLYLKLMAIPHTTVWVFGKKRYASEIPLAWLETSANGGVINRICFAIHHLEAFNRNRGLVVTNVQRKYAFRERIIDYCQAKMFGRIHLPCFLSTTAYVFQLSTGGILPVPALLEYSKRNDTPSVHFSRPTLDTSSLDKTMERIAGLNIDQQLAIKAIRKSVNIKPAQRSAGRPPEHRKRYQQYCQGTLYTKKKRVGLQATLRQKPAK